MVFKGGKKRKKRWSNQSYVNSPLRISRYTRNQSSPTFSSSLTKTHITRTNLSTATQFNSLHFFGFKLIFFIINFPSSLFQNPRRAYIYSLHLQNSNNHIHQPHLGVLKPVSTSAESSFLPGDLLSPNSFHIARYERRERKREREKEGQLAS